MTRTYAEPLAMYGIGIRTCRVQRGAESVRVVLSRIKVVRAGLHLVRKDAVGGSARCIADDEHAPTANIDSDGIRLAGGSLGDRQARPVAGASLVLPAHGGHLQQSADTLPGKAAGCRGVWRRPEPRSGAPACTLIVPPAGPGPSNGDGRRRYCACQPRRGARRERPFAAA